MQRLLLILTIVSFQNPGFCQEPAFRKNTISIESGIWSRGLFGLSYSRNFSKTKYLFLSSDASIGVGKSGFYYGLNAAINLGREELFFVAGVDLKRCVIQYSESFLFGDYYFKGFAYNPYVGLSLYVPSRLTIKIRGGIMPIYKSHIYDGFFPTAGVSLGYSF
jgi:hypothetical protein